MWMGNTGCRRKLLEKSLSPEEGAALFWYLRNELYFSLDLHKNKHVLLVDYQKLVTDPNYQFERIFNFIDISYDEAFSFDVNKASIGKKSFPDIDDIIVALCEQLEEKFNQISKY